MSGRRVKIKMGKGTASDFNVKITVVLFMVFISVSVDRGAEKGNCISRVLWHVFYHGNGAGYTKIERTERIASNGHR